MRVEGVRVSPLAKGFALMATQASDSIQERSVLQDMLCLQDPPPFINPQGEDVVSHNLADFLGWTLARVFIRHDDNSLVDPHNVVVGNDRCGCCWHRGVWFSLSVIILETVQVLSL
jgi:hypothetical protein